MGNSYSTSMMLIVENANAVSNGQLNTSGISKKRILNDDFDSPTISTCRSSSLSASSSLLALDISEKKSEPESVGSLHNDDCNNTKNSSSSSSSSSKNNKRNKRVGFKASASIRYYEIALGDI